VLEKDDIDVNVSVSFLIHLFQWLGELTKIRNLGVLFGFGIMREG